MMGREAFQEIDYRHMFGPMAKWVAQIDSADRIPELVSRAFHVATAGRPGPVVLALPEDMLVEESSAGDARPYALTRVASGARPTSSGRARCSRRRSGRSSIVGGAPWSAEAHAALTAWCDAERAPGRRRAGAARTTSTTRPTPTSATSRSAPTRASRSGCATPTSCS